jgi:hypothetical protein
MMLFPLLSFVSYHDAAPRSCDSRCSTLTSTICTISLCRLHVWCQSGGREAFDRCVKITRFTYNPEAATIGDPLDLISGLSGSVDDHRPHDVRSGRTAARSMWSSTWPAPCAGHQRRTDRWPMELWLADRVQVWGLQGSRKEHKSNYLVEDYTAACFFFCYHSVDLLILRLFQQSVFLPWPTKAVGFRALWFVGKIF